ncbi:hypothetical protein BJF85_12855 [Saccharomonospora sp. CUA-673]|nr:hypothetical protein BJF85_12855 [Saccharomonospora sp. CUA-673]
MAPVAPTGPRRLPAGDDGVATVWGAVAAAALFALAGMLWLLGHGAVVRSDAANAADLAALAAAGKADHGVDEACATAETVADRMRVRLVDCRLRPPGASGPGARDPDTPDPALGTGPGAGAPDALVRVEADRTPLLAPFGAVTARARAGPVGTAR